MAVKSFSWIPDWVPNWVRYPIALIFILPFMMLFHFYKWAMRTFVRLFLIGLVMILIGFIFVAAYENVAFVREAVDVALNWIVVVVAIPAAFAGLRGQADVWKAIVKAEMFK